MRGYFITVLNMSLTATYAAIAVMAVRILIKKVPKIFSYFLWAVVLFRLISPVSFESGFSLMTRKMESMPLSTINLQNPVLKGGIDIAPNAGNQAVQSPLTPASSAVNVNYVVIITEIAAGVWLLGIAFFLFYGALSYLRLKRRIATATLLKENIFETDRIKTPFVLGFINPKIYIPIGLDKKELDYILKHEQTHIKRMDYLIKPAAFLALVLHWFNPVMWVSYFLMARDMEMSCDESVIKQSREDIRASYSNSLLCLSVRQSGLLSPLAFGESNVKSRIKNVLNYKRTPFWIVASAVVAVAAVTVGLMANPSKAALKENTLKSGSVESFAWEVINRDIEIYESNPEVNIIDSKITRLELIERFEKLADRPIEVYALEFRLKPEDLSKVVMAGGMQADENGWIKETSSMGSPLLVLYRTSDSFEFMGTLTTGGVLEEGGLEQSIKALISRSINDYQDRATGLQDMADKGEIQWLLNPESAAEIALGLKGGYFSSTKREANHVTLEYSYEYQKVIIEMYQPVKKGEGGIWAVKSHRFIDI